MNSEFYKNFLQPTRLFQILGSNIRTSDGTLCRIRISRGFEPPGFDDRDKALLAHLERSVVLQPSSILSGPSTISTLVRWTNSPLAPSFSTRATGSQVADQLLCEKDGLKVRGGTLQIGNPRDG